MYKFKTFGDCPNCKYVVDFESEEVFEPEWIKKLTCVECKYQFEMKVDEYSRH